MFGRLPNESEDNYYVIDFDWAGKISKTFYPLSINMNEIEGCEGVAPGTEITPHHDNFLLDLIKMEYYDDIENSNSGDEENIGKGMEELSLTLPLEARNSLRSSIKRQIWG